MADISKVNVNSTDYDLKDQKSRDAIVDVVDSGAKNLFDMSGAQTFDVTGYGIHCTINKLTGVIILDGVNQDKKCTGSFNIKIADSTALGLQSGVVYKLNCDGYTTSDTTIGIYVYTSGATPETQFDTYSHTELAWNTAWEQSNGFRLFIRSGTVVNNITLRPMLCTKAEWDISQAYVPYGKTNAELTNDASTLFTENIRQETEIGVVANAGAKNLLKVSVPDAKTNAGNTGFTWSGNTASKNHVSFEIKDDLTVYVKSDTGYTASDVTIFYLTDGSCAYPNTILNGCPSGGSATTYELRTATPVKSDYGSGVKITSDSATNVVIIIRSGWSGELTFRPMIRSAAISDTSYQPYARTNPALTAEMDYAVNTGVKNIAPVNSGSGTSVNLFNRSCFVSAGQYILSYKASDFSGNYELAFYDAADTYIPGGLNGSITANKSVEFRLRADAYRMRFSILGTAKITELMLRPAAITDPTFQPYARTNRDLTVLTDEDRASLVELVDGGAKNAYPFGDLSGTGYILETHDLELPAGDYILYIGSITGLKTGEQVQFLFRDGTTNIATPALKLTQTYTAFNLTDSVNKLRVYTNAESNASFTNIMICTKAAWDISHAFQPYRLPYQEISDTVQALKKVHHYGFIIDKNNSDSYTAVSYTHGAVGFSPAYMDYTNNKFVYGSWADAWFIRDAVPVALNFDGTEAFELDKSDFTKKADGTASGIDCITMVLTDSQPSDWATNWKWYYTKSGDYYVAITDSSAPTWAVNTYYKAVSALDVNFMLRMPKVYFKRSNDAGHNYIEIADKQIDQDFHAYAHIDANGVEKDYIYLPLFKGSMINGKLRSVPNVWPQKLTTAQQEIDAASALGTGWQIWDHSSRELINDLLILISKSLDCQTTFGRGRESGYVDNPNQNYGLLKTGSLMDKGMFYGYSSSTKEVKVFGMESFWANRWDRMLGLILKDNVWKVKMQPPYNLTADGYATPSGASVPSGNAYFKSVHSSEYGSVPVVGGGEPSKYYRNYFYKNSSGTRVALVGGSCSTGAAGGFRCVAVDIDASVSRWSIGTSPVYK